MPGSTPPPPVRSAATAARLALAAVLLPCVAACTGFERDFDVSPLVRSSHRPATDITETDVAGPFVPVASRGEAEVFGLRPLFLTYEGPWHGGGEGGDATQTVTSILPPFAKYHSNPRTTQFRFWPLFWWTKERTVAGGLDFDWMLFPILFYGSTQPTPLDERAGDKDDRYFAIFPLAGQINTFAAYDRFQFLAWPLLQRLTKRIYDDEENFNSIALLIGWTTGYPRGGSWHALPLYYKSQWNYPPHRAPAYPEGADPSQPLPKYDKRCYLWPFIHKQTLHMDRGPGKETDVFAVWPLFRHEKAFDHEFWTILWPFFRYNIEVPSARDDAADEAGAEGDDDAGPAAAAADAPPNLLVHAFTQLVWKYERTQEHLRRRLLWFVYADYTSLPRDRKSRVDSMAILQPIGFWKRSVVEFQEKVGGSRDDAIYALVPFFQTHHKHYLDASGAEDGRTARFTKLWPLFSYERDDADGSRDVHLLSLLPLRLDRYVKDFNDAWGFAWNLYRYERAPADQGGFTRHTALFELIKVYRDDVETSVSVPLLYTYRTVPEGSERTVTHNFLGGLLGWEASTGPAGSSDRIKLFWIPIDV